MATIARKVYGDPGTLYARCGGVFGVASFVDRCMDAWMADDFLNANAKVARWHASAQRPGFKFLVVQIVCSLTGGPQQYTGRAMDEAHKHLNISEREVPRAARRTSFAARRTPRAARRTPHAAARSPLTVWPRAVGQVHGDIQRGVRGVWASLGGH